MAFHVNSIKFICRYAQADTSGHIQLWYELLCLWKAKRRAAIQAAIDAGEVRTFFFLKRYNATCFSNLFDMHHLHSHWASGNSWRTAQTRRRTWRVCSPYDIRMISDIAWDPQGDSVCSWGQLPVKQIAETPWSAWQISSRSWRTETSSPMLGIS